MALIKRQPKVTEYICNALLGDFWGATLRRPYVQFMSSVLWLCLKKRHSAPLRWRMEKE